MTQLRRLAEAATPTCPACGRGWEPNCEQHACIVLFGECIACRFMPDGKGSRKGTQADMDAIVKRRSEMLAALDGSES